MASHLVAIVVRGELVGHGAVDFRESETNRGYLELISDQDRGGNVANEDSSGASEP